MRIFLLLAALLAGTAGAAIPTTSSEYSLNYLTGLSAALQYSLGTMLREAHNTVICYYSKALQGGAVGTVNLKQMDGKTNCTLPANSIVRDGLIDVITVPVPSSQNSSLTIGLVTALDLKASTVASSYTGRLAVIPVGTAATAIKIGSAKTVTATIMSQTLSAGKFRVFLDYVLSEQ